MQRREALTLLGAAAAASGLTPAQLAASARAGRRGPVARVLTTNEHETLDAIAEAVMPATDTPGARAAGVPDFIEMLVAEWYGPEDREAFRRGLADVDARARAVAGVAFPRASPDQRVAILTGLEAEARVLRERAPDGPTPFFRRVKWLVLFGYYTSEIGMREELHWHVIPGRYDGCIDLAAMPVPGGD